MTDDKLRSIWGDDLFNYAYNKSIELVGSPLYDVMVMCAVGKINSKLGQLVGGLGL